jgi:hypothetical protein
MINKTAEEMLNKGETRIEPMTVSLKVSKCWFHWGLWSLLR